jgi:hypothetical protein
MQLDDKTLGYHTHGLMNFHTCIVGVICRNPTLAKCGGEAQHLEKLEVGSLPGLPNV